MLNEKNKNENVDSNMKFEYPEELDNKTSYEDNEQEIQVKPKHKTHIGYNGRLIIAISIFVISLIMCFLLVSKSFNYQNPKIINYNENGSLDYKVYLKENDFYEEKYLDENMIYVANLIDNINIDFNYDFNIEENSNIDFTYQVLGDLIISGQNGTSNFLEKKYVLSEEKDTKLSDAKNLNIKENIVIDYDYYNSIANDYKSSYAVDTNSYLKVYLRINKKDSDKLLDINDSSDVSLTIPLSQRAVEIALNSMDSDSNSKAISDAKLKFNSTIFTIEIIFIIIAIISLVRILKLLVLLTARKNAYDKYVGKLLREYDRLIVETMTGFDMSNCNIIKVKSFEELLDVRDNLKLPIMYYSVVKHSKCHFYIKNNSDIYLVTIKEVDLEGKENEK